MSLLNTLEKATYTGLGIASLTKDKVNETLEVLKKERINQEKAGYEFSSKIKEEVEAAKKKLEEKIEKMMNKMQKNMNFATKKEVASLEEKIAALESRLNSSTKKA